MLSDRFRAAVEQGDVHRAQELFCENAVFLREFPQVGLGVP